MRRKNEIAKCLHDAEIEKWNSVPSICTNCMKDIVMRRYTRKPPVPVVCFSCGRTDLEMANANELLIHLPRIIKEHFLVLTDANISENALSLAAVAGKILKIEDPKFCRNLSKALTKRDASLEKDLFFSSKHKYKAIFPALESPEEVNQSFLARWASVSESLVHHQRFFNKGAEQFFALLFGEAIGAKTNGLFRPTTAVVHMAPAGTILYRSRRVDNESGLKQIFASPERELGAPPKEKAGQNRMNPAGVPLFYASESDSTAIAEIRPSIGQRVAIGRFKTTRDLKLFDFRKLSYGIKPAELSYFHDHFGERLLLRRGISYLNDIIARPVFPGNENDYIVTQAMCDYLQHVHPEKFDGIMFSSVQEKGGVNYTIFSDISVSGTEPALAPSASFPLNFKGSVSVRTISGIKYDTKLA